MQKNVNQNWSKHFLFSSDFDEFIFLIPKKNDIQKNFDEKNKSKYLLAYFFLLESSEAY